MQFSVGMTPEKLPVKAGQTPIIQNLGPGDLYLDVNPDVTIDDGLKVLPDGSYEFLRDITEDVYAVSDQAATDVRIMVVG